MRPNTAASAMPCPVEDPPKTSCSPLRRDARELNGSHRTRDYLRARRCEVNGRNVAAPGRSNEDFAKEDSVPAAEYPVNPMPREPRPEHKAPQLPTQIATGAGRYRKTCQTPAVR